MNAVDLLNILEKRELVASGVLAALRKQVAAAGRPIAPASIIKVLIDKQELTPRQGEQLLQSAAAAGAYFPDPYFSVNPGTAYFVTGALTEAAVAKSPAVGNEGIFYVNLWSYPVVGIF